MCAPSPPPAPDYTSAAREQGAANVEAAKTTGQINNPNVNSPYGTQTVTWGGPISQTAENFDPRAYYEAHPDVRNAGLDAWQHYQTYGRNTPGYDFTQKADAQGIQPTITQQFSPEQQAIFDASNQAKLSLSQLANQGAGAAGEVIGKNVDLSGLPAAPGSAEATRTKVIDAMMGRVNEDYGRATDEKHSALIAAGLRPGTKAYDDQMQLLQRGRNDAAQQAYLAGGQEMTRDFTTDTQRRKDALAEYLAQRQVPLNEITALMSGSQVNNPFAVPTYAQNAQVAPAPLFGAQNALAGYNTDVYNAQAAQAGNLQSGLFGLGGAGLMGAGMAFSDRRLKSKIRRIGTHPLGIGWYAYEIDGHPSEGVMADEVLTVRPEAVVQHVNGYYMVEYARLLP